MTPVNTKIVAILLLAVLEVLLMWRVPIVLQVLYFVRYPLGMLLAVPGLVLLCVSVPRLLRNLLVLERDAALANITWMSLFTTLVGQTALRVTLVNAERFPDVSKPIWPLVPWNWLDWVVLLACGLPVPVAALWHTRRDKLDAFAHRGRFGLAGQSRPTAWSLVGWLTTGVAAFVGIVFALATVRAMLPQEETMSLPFDQVGIQLANRLGWESPSPFPRLLVHTFSPLGPGYIRQTTMPDGEVRSALAPGHFELVAMLVLVVLLYLLFYARVVLQYRLTGSAKALPREHTLFPSLFLALWIVLIAGMSLSAMSFFLDFYRIPVLVTVVMISMAMYTVWNTDHVFELAPPRERTAALPNAPQRTLSERHDHQDDDRDGPESIRDSSAGVTLPGGRKTEPPRPREVAERASSATGAERIERIDVISAFDRWTFPQGDDGQRTFVAVCASGGGIQAAAWTARVLTGLHERYGDRFTRSVGLISGVSGGAVGSMFYLLGRSELSASATTIPTNNPALNALAQPSGRGMTALSPESIARIMECATESSLDAAAWGLAFPDLLRMFLPPVVDRRIDRGWAVEESWRARMAAFHDLRLGDLVPAIRNRQLPALLFNATIAETGQRMMISPLVLGIDPKPTNPLEFVPFYETSETRLSTAALLSATFPFVSPMSRPIWPDGNVVATEIERQRRSVHFADGGYTDNEGLLSVLLVLDRLIGVNGAASVNQRKFDRVLVLRIHPFPAEATAGQPGQNRGWFYEVAGPIDALQNVRVASQAERGNLELGLLKASAHLKTKVLDAGFVFGEGGNVDAEQIPLSWRMSRRQKLYIEEAWQQLLESRDRPRAANRQPHPLTALDKMFGAS